MTTPVNGGVCPPGHYMLFIMNDKGVPSVGKIVRITGSNAVADFSADQNPIGRWSYGYKAVTAGATFARYSERSSPDGPGLNKWSSANGLCCPAVVHNSTGTTQTYVTASSVKHPPDLLNVHPGANGERSLVRWTASAAGAMKIEGRFEGLDTIGTTTDVAVTHNSSSTLFNAEINGDGKVASFSFVRVVNAGDTIDFSVGVGSNGGYENDSTGLAVSITPVPWLTSNVVSEFSGKPNPQAVWSYGYRASAAAEFRPHTSASQPCGAGTMTLSMNGSVDPGITHNATTTNIRCGSVDIPPDMLNLHPGPNGERSVVRWTAPFAGLVRLAGKFKGLDTSGTTSDVAVTHNSVAVFSSQVNGYGVEARFALLLAVGTGDIIEFSVGFGSNSTYYNDSTGLAVTINPARPDHVVNDFSMSRNPAGVWDYGYRASAQASFTRYGNRGRVFNKGLDTWYQETHEPNVTRNKTGRSYLTPNLDFPPDVISLHPGPKGERSVVRWTAQAGGTVQVSGRFIGIARHTTSDVAVTHNSESVVIGSINSFGSEVPVKFTRAVTGGDILEFSVGWGDNQDFATDTTGLTVTITRH